MSSTQHEVGPVPSATNTVDPLVVAAPKHLHFTVVAVISFLVPLAGLIMAIGYNKKVIAHNAQVEAPKVSARNYWLTVGISVALAFTAVVATHLPQNNPANATYIVVGTGPAAPSVQPSPAAPSAAVQAPEPVATNPVETGPIQPVASTPEGTIRAIEAYRNAAYQTGDTAPLADYFAIGISPTTDFHYRFEVSRINNVKPQHLVGQVSESVTKVEMISATPSMMVAHVTIKETVSGVVKTTMTFRSVYVVVNGRWLVRSFANAG